MAHAEIDAFSNVNVNDISAKQNKTDIGSKTQPSGINWWSSALVRRIILFNLIALCVLFLGILYLNQSKQNLEAGQLENLNVESSLYAQLLQERIENNQNAGSQSEALLDAIVQDLPAPGLAEIHIFDETSARLTTLAPNARKNSSGHNLSIVDKIIYWFKSVRLSMFGNNTSPQEQSHISSIDEAVKNMAVDTLDNGQQSLIDVLEKGQTIIAAAEPIVVGGANIGVIVAASPAGLIDELRRNERNNILGLFALAACLSILLSLVLARTIANPIRDLADAMEAGTSSKLRKDNPNRVRIPDLDNRDDEIGHLSTAMRDMTSALYHRIDSNEQFAADVAHEIKNPLASLRSAIETLRIAPEGEKRNKLLDVVEHDVRRLDRLVSDISNASRLDSDLVKEEEENFDLSLMLRRIVDFHSIEAKDVGIELIYDQQGDDIFIDGLEERLAQVFVNLITNAISFCEKGDAVRLWARNVENRVLVVVEDTGQGIPEDSLTKVFKRFYSNRSVESFGNNSGLGLSISKQIVEAHGGVIWAENIYEKGTEQGSEPLGARFIVGLPG